MITWNTYSDKTAFEGYSESSNYTYYATNGQSDHGQTTSASASYSFTESDGESSYTHEAGIYESSSYSASAGGGGVYTGTTYGFQYVYDTSVKGFSSSSFKGSTMPGYIHSNDYGNPTSTDVDSTTSASGTFGSNTYYFINTTSLKTSSFTDYTSSEITVTVPSYTTTLSGTSTILSISSQTTHSTGTAYDTTTVLSGYDYDADSNTTATGFTHVEITASVPYTSTVLTDTTLTASKWQDIGTVISAYGNEWLWRATDTPSYNEALNTGVGFISDIGESFKVTTLWPLYVSQVVSFISYGSITPGSSSNGDSTTALTTNFYEYGDDSYSTTITYGDTFARSTTDSTLNSTSNNTGAFTAGVGTAVPYVGVVPSTYDFFSGESTITVGVYSSTQSTVLLPADLDNTTTTVSASTNVKTTYAFTVEQSDLYYLASGSGLTTVRNSDAGGQTSSGFTSAKAGTATDSYFAMPSSHDTGGIQGFQRVPKQNGLYSPDAISQGSPIGTNISLSQTVYYPFTSSVLDGVVTPLRTNTTAVEHDTNKTASTSGTSFISYSLLSFGYPTTTSYSYSLSTYYTDVTKWSYEWSSYSLYFTSATSDTTVSNSATITTYSTKSHSAIMSRQGDNGGSYYNTVFSAYLHTTNRRTGLPTAVGGYSPFSTDGATILYGPGGRAVTNYDTDGNSTTTLTIVDSVATASLSETIHVENSLPVYSTVTGSWPVVSFTAYG